MRDPFRPGFGISPPLLVGRADAIADFSRALDDGPGSFGRTTLLVGRRGVGKAVLLNALEKEARGKGWLAISETASVGLVGRLVGEHLPRLLAECDPDATRRRFSGFTLPASLGSVAWVTEQRHRPSPGLRGQLADLAAILAENQTGLLITLDEIGPAITDEIREFFTSLQHCLREELEIAFAGAGLPEAVDAALNDEMITFLRRANRYDLGPVDPDDVQPAIWEPIYDAGRSISPEACALAASGTDGFPFLIQLVGSYAWRAGAASEVSVRDVSTGVQAARRRIGQLVHGPELKRLSKVDKSFLLAMAKDDDVSRMADIASRLNVDLNYAGQYRLRLLQSGLISVAGIGQVRLAMPELRDYLRDHAAHELP